jgi:hypothetical protein
VRRLRGCWDAACSTKGDKKNLAVVRGEGIQKRKNTLLQEFKKVRTGARIGAASAARVTDQGKAVRLRGTTPLPSPLR